MSNSIFTPTRSLDLRQIVYEKIRNVIVSGVIPAGTRLSEVQLAQQLEVSRTPVREAIRQLSESGLVRLTPRRGAYVVLPTARDARELYEIRSALELIPIDYICANPPVETLQGLRKRFESVDNSVNQGDFSEMDSAFHQLLSTYAHNHFLDTMLGNVGDLIQICRHYSIGAIPPVSSSREHICIIDALLEKNAPLAREKMIEHLNNTRDALLIYIEQHPEVSLPDEE